VRPPNDVHWTPRARNDFKECLDFIGRQSWGKPADRELDIFVGVEKIRRDPRRARVQARRPRTGVDLRRHDAAQFAIIYALIEPNDLMRKSIVSIRAIRHRRVRDVFQGVREPPPPAYIN
jgi:plasmid stabilization system protein ParE